MLTVSVIVVRLFVLFLGLWMTLICFFSVVDSYSDNSELSTAAKKLEDAIDGIICTEEQKRA